MDNILIFNNKLQTATVAVFDNFCVRTCRQVNHD